MTFARPQRAFKGLSRAPFLRSKPRTMKILQEVIPVTESPSMRLAVPTVVPPPPPGFITGCAWLSVAPKTPRRGWK